MTTTTATQFVKETLVSQNIKQESFLNISDFYRECLIEDVFQKSSASNYLSVKDAVTFSSNGNQYTCFNSEIVGRDGDKIPFFFLTPYELVQERSQFFRSLNSKGQVVVTVQ